MLEVLRRTEMHSKKAIDCVSDIKCVWYLRSTLKHWNTFEESNGLHVCVCVCDFECVWYLRSTLKDPNTFEETTLQHYLMWTGMSIMPFYLTGHHVKCIVDEEEKMHCIDMIHTCPGVRWKNHLGRDKTINEVMTWLFWPKISWDVWHYVACCAKCNNCSSKPKPQQELQPVKVHQKFWYQIGINLMQLYETEGYNYILTAICYFSKWVELIPLCTKTALEVAEALCKLICKWGVWLTLDVFQSFEVLRRYQTHPMTKNMKMLISQQL